jgi:hypothetical protein
MEHYLLVEDGAFLSRHTIPLTAAITGQQPSLEMFTHPTRLFLMLSSMVKCMPELVMTLMLAKFTDGWAMGIGSVRSPFHRLLGV